MNVSHGQFWEELEEGEIHIRDKLQFELKSEFIPHTGSKVNQYSQEFYLFVPSSLQINPSTYLKTQFYLDETNLIRYKTPEFTFRQLLDLKYGRSPLARVYKICLLDETSDNRQHLSDELKLLGNVLRSTLRQEVKCLMSILHSPTLNTDLEDFHLRVKQLAADITQFNEIYSEIEKIFLNNWADNEFHHKLLYIREFISDSVSYYITGFLESIRLSSNANLKSTDDLLCKIIIQNGRKNSLFIREKGRKNGFSNSVEGENFLYRSGLLNKFVMNALQLTTNRFTLEQRYGNWIGGISAGIAMLLYISLFIWLGGVFVINSEPFLLLTVVIYILKDRIKDWLRSYSYLQASKWFPDYTTIIQSLDQKSDIGVIKESFSFIDIKQLPKDIKDARDRESQTILENFQQPENVLFYKRIVEIYNSKKDNRRNSLNIIFRFNIHRFLRKAGDAIETHLALDPHTHKLFDVNLRKVYHLNLIIRSSSSTKGQSIKTELKRLRIIIDKSGIQRIEQLSKTLDVY